MEQIVIRVNGAVDLFASIPVGIRYHGEIFIVISSSSSSSEANVSFSCSGSVLVTGATGFIGRHLVARLVELGCVTRALVLPGDPIPPSWGEKVEVFVGDITNRPEVEESLRGMGTVIHLAAMVGDWGEPSSYRRVTVEGTENVLGIAARRSIRAVLSSSIVVYGDRVGKEVCDEDTPHGRAPGIYTRSKQMQEQVARHLEETEGLVLTIVRPSNVYGPGSVPWVDKVSEQLLRGLPALVGGGEQNAGLAHVHNVVDIFLRAAFLPQARGRTYNACDTLDITWKRYFGDLASILEAPRPRNIPRFIARISAGICECAWNRLRLSDRPPVTREALNLVGSHHRISSDRVREELGHSVEVGYEEGLQTVRRYLEESFLVKG